MTAQERFDAKYITTLEIAKDLQVSRVSIQRARELAHLPEFVVVNQRVIIYEREKVAPYVAAWKAQLEARRQKAVA